MDEIARLWQEYLDDDSWWTLTDPDEDSNFTDFMLWWEKQQEEIE